MRCGIGFIYLLCPLGYLRNPPPYADGVGTELRFQRAVYK